MTRVIDMCEVEMKFFVNDNQIVDNNIEILGQDVNHIKNVLRKRIDDCLEVVCKQTNKNYIAKIVSISQDKINLDILEENTGNSESSLKIHIFQGLPKSDKMELIIQKCTEIGVSDITPVELKRCVVKLDGKDREKKILRWRKIAEVAAKQSERDSILEVHDIIDITKLCNMFCDFDKVIVAYEKEENLYIKEVLKSIEYKENLKIAVVIGPEGGIDEEEIDIMKKNEATTVSLGNRILRTETAPIVLSSIVMYELGDLGGK